MVQLPGPLRFARMAGSSIAAPGAIAWVTDFLNASYYARSNDERDVDDLRLAHGVITTCWALRGGTRLGARDVLALNRAYGMLRLRRRGRLDGEALRQGAAKLLGEWFPDAWADDERRAYGIGFPTVAERYAFKPERRLEDAALGPLTPPRREPAERHWSTYTPVALEDPDAALAFLADAHRWPDIGCASGRFTPLRSGRLAGQTFEIEVVAEPTPRSPVFMRGYVTCTELHTRDGERLRAAVGELAERYRAGAGRGATPLLPSGAEPLGLIVLTTHEGHFLGRALSQLLVWRDAAGAWIRDVGSWDPLPPHLAAAYRARGRQAQEQFWGPAPAERSMLAQLALTTAGRRNSAAA
jgi:hypothetical protein